MNNRIGFVGLIVGLVPFILLAQAQVNQTFVTGFVTDTLSGKHGATALHGDVTKRNVASGLAKYAIYDEKTRKLYIIEPQSTAAAYLGQRVTVTGTLAASPMAHAGQHVNPQTNRVEDLHKVGQDSSTPVAGVLTNSTITATPPKVQRN
jgi:hypothetical protein